MNYFYTTGMTVLFLFTYVHYCLKFNSLFFTLLLSLSPSLSLSLSLSDQTLMFWCFSSAFHTHPLHSPPHPIPTQALTEQQSKFKQYHLHGIERQKKKTKPEMYSQSGGGCLLSHWHLEQKEHKNTKQFLEKGCSS